jgi:hypothetical protein
MKRLGLWLSLAAMSLTSASAQVTVEVLLDQDQFLPGEALVAAVRITNRSGQTLRLGKEPDWLTFSIESHESWVVPKTGEPPVEGVFSLESSEMGTKRVDLGPYFSLGRPGRYSIIATVRIRDWEREITSQPKDFYLIQGARLWEQDFGVPKSAGDANAAPEVRKYLLQQANYIKGQLRLYVRVTDAAGTKNFRVLPVGQMVSISRPQPLVDKASHLHVLFQNGAHSYNYTEINPEGEVVTRQTFDYISSRPRLREGDGGLVSVVGGVRRITATDVPAPVADTESVTNDQPIQPPAKPKPAKP